MATVTIQPGAAVEDAKRIGQIVNKIAEDMATLDKAIKTHIAFDSSQPDGIITTWSTTVRENWEGYYTTDIPNAMENMKASATNLELAVNEALNFSNEG